MSEPCIITVAITGALPTKDDTPAVPVTPSEQIESTHEAFEAGASLVHIHVRNEDQTPSSNPDKYCAVQEGVEKHCPGMIIQFSTGGRGRDQEKRGAMLVFLFFVLSILTIFILQFPCVIAFDPLCTLAVFAPYMPLAMRKAINKN